MVMVIEITIVLCCNAVNDSHTLEHPYWDSYALIIELKLSHTQICASLLFLESEISV